jgi:hypothetical protein
MTYTINQAVDVNAAVDIGNIQVSTNTISSTNTDGDILLSPNGTGNVGINTASPTAKLHITTSSGKRALEINGDPGSEHAQVYMSGATYGFAIATNNTSASYYGLSINNSSTNTFIVLGNGQVGIGNSAPTVGKLNVNGYVGGSVSTGYYTEYNGSGGIRSVAYGGSSFAYSIYCSNAFGCNGIGWSSDERIKTEITVVDDAWALQKVRDIECKEYHYRDPLMRKEHKTIGYIAQDIKQHLPQAVSTIEEYVPDEMRPIENITWTPTEGGFRVIIPSLTFSTEHTRKLLFYVTLGGEGEEETESRIELIADEENAVIFEKQYSTVFLYGKKVNNFLQIAKDKIYSLHHSAIQEIDRRQTTDNERILELEGELSEAQETIATQAQDIATLKAQVAALMQHTGVTL